MKREYIIEAEAITENIEELSFFSENKLRELGMSEDWLQKLLMALDEAIINIIMYAYDKDKGKIKIVIRHDNDLAELELVDSGKEFDPTAQSPASVNVPLEERKAGGMGLNMIKLFTDELKYCRKNGFNHFFLIKRTGLTNV